MMVRLIKFLCLTALLGIVSCGVSEKTLTAAEKKIDELKAAGVPDSTLSTVKVHLYQVKDAQQRGNTGVAKEAARNMKRELAAVEATYKENLTRLMPVIDSLKSVIRATRSGLTGLQLKKLDSMMVASRHTIKQRRLPRRFLSSTRTRNVQKSFAVLSRAPGPART